MGRRVWNKEMIEFLKDNYSNPNITTREIADKLGLSYSSVKSKASTLKLKTGKIYEWTQEEIETVKKEYPHIKSQVLADKIGCSIDQLYTLTSRLNITKTDAYLLEMQKNTNRNLLEHGKAFRFTKGQTPPNKGRKQKEYMSNEAIERTAKTRFKKGNTPVNHKPIGSERMTKDGYITVKIKEPRTWKLKHRIVWEEHNGEIPKDMIVVFKGDDRTDVRIENLELIYRVEHLKNNTIQRYPDELIKVIRRTARLKKTINKIQEN